MEIIEQQLCPTARLCWEKRYLFLCERNDVSQHGGTLVAIATRWMGQTARGDSEDSWEERIHTRRR